MLGTLAGLIVFIVDVWAILQVFQSRESTGTKVLWTALIVFLPIIGLIIWYFAGPRGQAG